MIRYSRGVAKITGTAAYWMPRFRWARRPAYTLTAISAGTNSLWYTAELTI
jgi:hypothetical protein